MKILQALDSNAPFVRSVCEQAGLDPPNGAEQGAAVVSTFAALLHHAGLGEEVTAAEALAAGEAVIAAFRIAT